MHRRNTRVMPHLFKWGLLSLSINTSSLFSATETAQGSAIMDVREQLRQQERERILQQKNSPDADVRLKRPAIKLSAYPHNEHPCFTVNTITLLGEKASRFQWALEAAADARGRCLGEKGVLLVINNVQNAILARGYVTTRLMVQEQDLTSGVLTLMLQPGRIDTLRFDKSVSWRGRLWNAVPAASGDLLNLRDIEQGLENLQRVPSVTADIEIVPGGKEGSSDLLIHWKQKRPVRLSLGADDSGSKSTGRYLSSVTLALDAPFAQNDLFYVSSGQDLFNHLPSGNRSRTLNYFFPMGYWAFSANYNDYTYHQNIPNASQILTYSGNSENVQLTLSRLLFRNQSHKTTLNLRTQYRYSANAVDGIEIENQHRRTAGWELGLNQRSYLGSATLDANINWRRGTGAWGALRAPEEAEHNGSTRKGILRGDISLNQPCKLGKQPWRYYTSLRGQWSAGALVPQDRLAIGGRYTVRGTDGEQVLSGEKGVVWRNELAWNVLSQGQELYIASDYGRVDGPGTRYLAGRQLAGGALGIRGALWQRFTYDLFAGVPFLKPQGFNTSGVTAGFTVNLEI